MRMKKICAVLISLMMISRLDVFSVFASKNVIDLSDVSADGIAVVDMNSGRLLYGKNENKKMAMASTTKIMTALITLEQENLDEYFEVDSDAINIEGTSMGLIEGDSVSLRALAVGMLLPSGNDAAEVAALRIAGSRSGFLKLMNERAKVMGCKNTHFATTSGLDDKEHYTTPSDMSRIARCALNNSDFAEICNKKYQTVRYGNPPYDRTLKNHNKLLERYPYCLGIKTGFTDDAGRCLVSAAKKDDKGVIVVTLHSQDICQTHIDIYDRVFDRVYQYTPNVRLPINNIKVVGGEVSGVEIKKSFDSSILLARGEEKELTHKIKLKKFLFAPVKKGEVVGEIDYYIDGEVVATEPIATSSNVEVQEKKSVWQQISSKFSKK